MSDSIGTGHVLLVEDDARFASLVEQHLRGHGYIVTLADSLAAAADCLGRGDAGNDAPDVVLLDINLPDDAGWGLLADPAYAISGAPPVVVITATAVSPRKLRVPGIAGCLTKPFAMETLRSTIERVLHPEVPPDRMTDLSIALVGAACVVALGAYLLLCERVRR